MTDDMTDDLSAPELTDDDREFGRLMFARECRFIMGGVSFEGLPGADRPEVAFCGRSNVGKSSLVNALTGRKTLARTSNTPGRTQQLNYFELGEKQGERLYLVDLPGYGYARAPKTEVAAWTEVVMTYLRGRPNLRRVMLLIDARHGLKQNDQDVMKMLDTAAVSYQVVMTKLDKLKARAQPKAIEAMEAAIKPFIACYPQVLATSAEKKIGIEDARAAIAKLAKE